MSDFGVNFSGIVHDHKWATENPNTSPGVSTCPTIAILKRHPMYDCLVLVKKYKKCLKGYALEFPMVGCHDLGEVCLVNEVQNQNNELCRRKMVSRYLDGDDPWKFGPIIPSSIAENHHIEQSQLDDAIRQGRTDTNLRNQNPYDLGSSSSLMNKYPPQIDDLGQVCDLVTVPINGLLDRLQLHTESGISVDSKVYAFAMGLKTAERILTRSSMQEISETPI